MKHFKKKIISKFAVRKQCKVRVCFIALLPLALEACAGGEDWPKLSDPLLQKDQTMVRFAAVSPTRPSPPLDPGEEATAEDLKEALQTTLEARTDWEDVAREKRVDARTWLTARLSLSRFDQALVRVERLARLFPSLLTPADEEALKSLRKAYREAVFLLGNAPA